MFLSFFFILYCIINIVTMSKIYQPIVERKYLEILEILNEVGYFEVNEIENTTFDVTYGFGIALETNLDHNEKSIEAVIL